MAIHIQRREFIVSLSSMAAWPLTARAQQADRMRRIGVLMNRAADNPDGQDRIAAFHQGLQELGWRVGRNVQIETRWGQDDADRERKYATELFAGVTDPVGAGFVDSLARPGRNATGFMIYEYSLSAKWLELLKQIAPSVTRVAVIRNPDNPAGLATFGAIQNAAQSLGFEVRPVTV